ncbi:MAG: sulfate transporter CysZ [Methyloprofundus sp.]|nr:sulfate transporter CysZ [Methyloprofundus sp.]
MELDKKAGLNPLLAVQSLLAGAKLVGHKELRKFVLIPVFINLILFSTLLYLVYTYVEGLIGQFIPDWLLWLSWLIYPLTFISFCLAGFFTFTLIANLIAAPFYGNLSAKTQKIIAHETGDIVEQKMLAVIGSELKRVVYLVSRAIPVLIISFIPGLNIIAPILWLLFGAWALSLEYFAYPLENEWALFKEQRDILSTVRIGALSFGGLVLVGLTLPIINILVPPIAVISATIYRQKLANNS